MDRWEIGYKEGYSAYTAWAKDMGAVDKPTCPPGIDKSAWEEGWEDAEIDDNESWDSFSKMEW